MYTEHASSHDFILIFFFIALDAVLMDLDDHWNNNLGGADNDDDDDDDDAGGFGGPDYDIGGPGYDVDDAPLHFGQPQQAAAESLAGQVQLIDEGRKVQFEAIDYARVAKRVDIRGLKEGLWTALEEEDQVRG